MVSLWSKKKEMNKIDYDEFFEETWDYVSEHIVNDRYYRENQSYIRAVTSKLYTVYLESDISTRQCGYILEAVFLNMFDLKPSQEKNKDAFC